MRKFLLPATMAAAVILPSMSALASEGTITFSGSLVNNTCQVSAGSNLTVTLPKLSVSALSADGMVAGNTPFALSVASCPGGIAGVTPYFEINRYVDPTSGLLGILSGGATNVQLQLTNANGSVINLSKPSGAQGVATATVTSGSATSNFAVRYIAKGGAAGQGAVSTSITFSMVYN